MGPGGIQKGSYDASKLTQDQRNWLYNQFGHSGQAPIGYGGEGGSGSSGGAQDAMTLAKQAQDMQVQANQPAIQTLQGQQTSLAQQYKTLLDSVINQGSAAMNTTTSGENAYLGDRGLLSQAGLGNTQLSQAQTTQQAQNQSAAAQVGMGSAQDINSLAAQIASLQAGNVGQALGYSSNISGVQAQIQAAQIAAAAQVTAATSQPKYIFGQGLPLNTSTGKLTIPSFSTPIP